MPLKIQRKTQTCPRLSLFVGRRESNWKRIIIFRFLNQKPKSSLFQKTMRLSLSLKTWKFLRGMQTFFQIST